MTRLHRRTKAEFVKVAILECLRQRIFLTTETWSKWLNEHIGYPGVNLKKDEARSPTTLLEHRQIAIHLEASMEQLVKTMEYVMNSLEIEEEWHLQSALKHDLLDLRDQCECGRAFVKHTHDIIQTDWDQRQIAVEIKSAEESARLTLLATIFLPLSLSTSLLAMSTRLKKLHLLLYDFVGVAILLSSLAVVIYGIVLTLRKISRSAKDQSKLVFNFRPVMMVFLRNGKFVFWPFYALSYVLVVVAFLVGMLKDVTVGWKMLVASIVGVPILFIMCPVVYSVVFIMRKLFRRRKKPRSLPAAFQLGA